MVELAELTLETTVVFNAGPLDGQSSILITRPLVEIPYGVDVHMHGLAVWETYIKNLEDSYSSFPLALLHSVSFLFLS